MFLDCNVVKCQIPLSLKFVLFYLWLNLILCSQSVSFENLGDRIYAESRLPAYLNKDNAILVFERMNVKETITLELTFREIQTQHVPAAAVTTELSGPTARQELTIDISSWPDGEYQVTIHESNDRNRTSPLIRGIRKQTLKSPLPPAEPIRMDGLKMLFIDDWHIAHSAGIKKQVNQSEQIPIEPWRNDEQFSRHNTSIQEFWFDQNKTMYARLSGRNTLRGEQIVYWVKSKDLKNWHVVEEPGTRAPDKVVRLNSMSRPVTSADRRYRYYDHERDGKVELSEVNVRWSGIQRNTQWGDVEIPYRSRIAVWEKDDGQSLILGSPVTVDKHIFEPDEIGTWSDSNDNFGDAHLDSDGNVLRFYQTRLIPRHDPLRVHYDNVLCDRIMVTWSTTDGLQWTPTFFDVPTLDDPPASQHYGVDVWFEENKRLQLAYHRIYDVQMQRVYTELAYSRDGLLWNRIDNALPFLDNGNPGEWNFGYSITASDRTRLEGPDGYYYEPMRGINVLHFMFLVAHNKDSRTFITADYFKNRFGGRTSGEKGVQTSPIWGWYGSWEKIAEKTQNQKTTPGLMRYRADGWVSVLPITRRGQIRSKVLTSNNGLHVNAKTTSDGFVMIEVLDKEGNYLSDYSGHNAARFSGDNIAQKLTWSQGGKHQLPDNPFILLITLEKAEIYALQF